VYTDEKMLDIINTMQQEEDKLIYQKYVSKSIQAGRLDIDNQVINFDPLS
jgi:hypothetical protein